MHPATITPRASPSTSHLATKALVVTKLLVNKAKLLLTTATV